MQVGLVTRRSLLFGAALGAVAVEAGFAVANATVIDGKGGVLQGHTVVWRGDRIESVGTAPVPAGTVVMDGRGRFVVPGFWDMHVHLSVAGAGALGVLLANGVTSVRDMGGRMDELGRWKAGIEAGSIAGPRIFRAGPIVNGKVFNELQIAVEDKREAHGAVRALHSSGADFIKVHAAISRDAYFGVKEECEQLGIRFAGHVPRAVDPGEASDARQASLEHLYTIFDGTRAAGVEPGQMPDFIRKFRASGAAELFERFARNGTAVNPTLVIEGASLRLMEEPDAEAVKYSSAFGRKLVQEMRVKYKDLYTREYVDSQRRQLAERLPLIGMLERAGVAILAGTDMGSGLLAPGFSLHQELALLVDAGLSPMQALVASTRRAAQCLGQADMGVIDKGMRADFVVLSADPLRDIRNTRRIEAVVARGKAMDRRALDSLLAMPLL